MQIATINKVINIVLRNRYIHKYRYCTVLDCRCYGCRETCCNRDNLVPSFNSSVT